MSVSISARDLAQIAKTPDRELRIEQQDGVNVLASNEGGFGGRLARSLKIATNSDGRATNHAKQDQYEDAANAVYNSLVKTYGQDIAFKAFKAGLGHQTNGQWEHSWNHPITGRHIQKMLSTAQKELKANNEFRVTQGPWDAFRDRSRDTVTRGPTLLWYQQSATQGSSPDTGYWRQPDVRDVVQRLQDHGQSGVPGFETLGLTVRSPLPQVERDYDYKRGLGLGESLADQLLTDAGARPNDQPDSTPDFWQLNVRSSGMKSANAIGIRIDRNAPNTVHVFDPNRGEFSVPRNELAGFLGQHLKDYYGDVSVHTLSRVDQVKLGGAFVTFEGNPISRTITADQLNDAQKHYLSDLANRDALVPGPGTARLSDQFLKDVNRQHTTVQSERNGEVIRQKLTTDNCDKVLENLLPDNLDQPNRDRALGNLSQLVGQTPFNAMQSAFHGSLRTGDLGMLNPTVLPASRNVELRSCKLDDDRPGIEIIYHIKRPITGYSDITDPMDIRSHGLNPDSDYMRDTMALRVAIEDLVQQPNDGEENQPFVPRFTISSEPTRDYHIERPPPEIDARRLSFRTGRNERTTADLGDIIPHYRMEMQRQHMQERLSGHREITLETGHQVSDAVFHQLHERSAATLAIGEGLPRPLRLSDAVGERLADAGLNAKEVLEVSKLFDQTLLDHALLDTGRALGMTADELQIFMTQGRGLDVRVNKLPDGTIDVTLSNDVTRLLENQSVSDNIRGLPDDQQDARLNLSLKFRLKVSDDGVERQLLGSPRLEFAAPTRLGSVDTGYAFRDGKVDQTLELDQQGRNEFRTLIGNDLSLANNPDLRLHDDFVNKDMNRMTLTVQTQNGPKLLTPNKKNVEGREATEGEHMLRDLVGGDGVKQDRAVARLSKLMNMRSAAALFNPGIERLHGVTGCLVNDPEPGEIHITRNGDNVELSYFANTRLDRLRDMNNAGWLGTTRSTDSFKTQCKIQIPLEQLRGEGQPNFNVTAWPSYTLHVESYRGRLEDRAPDDPLARPEAIHTGEENGIRTVDIDSVSSNRSARLRAMREQVRAEQLMIGGDVRMAKSAWQSLMGAHFGPEIPDGAEKIEASLLHARNLHHEIRQVVDDDQQTEQLSRLLNRNFIDEAFRGTVSALGASNVDAEGVVKGLGDIAIDVRETENDPDSLDITFTRRADGLFKCDGINPFLDREEISQDTDKLDVTVALRVRRQDLIDGHPERFQLLHGARLEVRPKVMGD